MYSLTKLLQDVQSDCAKKFRVPSNQKCFLHRLTGHRGGRVYISTFYLDSRTEYYLLIYKMIRKLYLQLYLCYWEKISKKSCLIEKFEENISGNMYLSVRNKCSTIIQITTAHFFQRKSRRRERKTLGKQEEVKLKN